MAFNTTSNIGSLISMKTLLALFVTAATFAAFGQGKIRFDNDFLHLVYYTPDTSLLLPGDVGLAGQGVSSGLMPGGGSLLLVADLYAGTSSASLSLVSTTTFGSLVGMINSADVLLPVGLPAGTLFFQVQVRDQAFATTALSLAGGSYGGSSVIFTTLAGPGPGYNSIVNPVLSTWPPGDFDMSTQTGISGAKGAIRVSLIPEPGVLLVVGLGVCAWGLRKKLMSVG